MSCKVQTIILVVSFLALLSGCLMPPGDFDTRQDIFPAAPGDSWCSADHAKRIDINVNNTGGSALTDYQVYINLSANSINETSIRVYNSSDCTLRSHWCENETGGNCYALWTNYSAVAGSSWTNNTAIYYDNAAACSTSSGKNTFVLFDDFDDGTTINSTTWNDTVEGSASQSGGILRVGNGGSTISWGSEAPLISQQNMHQNISIYTRMRDAPAESWSGILWQYQNKSNHVYFYIGNDGTDNYMFGDIISGASHVWTSWSGAGYDVQTYQNYRILTYGGGQKIYRNDVLLDSDTSVAANGNNKIAFYGRSGGSYLEVDWIYVCKYVSVEPESELGTEESQPGFITITNKQPTSPISKSSQAANFAINATISETTNNSWEINRTGSYEHLEWDNSTTAPAYTFSPQTEGIGTYKIKLTAYNATTPTYNASTTWDVTVSSITISSPSPGLTNVKYVSNRTVTYSATPSRTANCSWKYQNGTLIEWDNSTVAPSMELWINSSTVTAFNISLTAYDYDYPSDYNSTSWNNSITDDIFDYTNFTWKRWGIFDDKIFTGCSANIEIGDIDNDGADEIVLIEAPLYFTTSKGILVYEMDQSYKWYPATTTSTGCARDISVHDVDQDGENELVVLLTKSTDMIAEIFRFNTTAITASNMNKDVGTSGSNSPKAIAWTNISDEEHFYTCGCGAGETVNVFLNLTQFSASEIDDYGHSAEDNIAWDIDNDGDLELLVIEGYAANAAKIWMYEINKTTGNYDSKTMLFDNDLSSTQHYTAWIITGDVDNDGIDNLIVFWGHNHPDTPTFVGPIEAYEFDGITNFGEGNYSEGFSIVSTANSMYGWTVGSHGKYMIDVINTDGNNSLVIGTVMATSHDANVASYVWNFDIGTNGTTITKSAIAEFPTSYMGGATHFIHSAIPRVYTDGAETKIFLSISSESNTDLRETEFFVLTTIKSVGTPPAISNVQNGSISPTSQYINWTVNQTAHNRVVYDKGSVATNSVACDGQWSATHACLNASDGNWASYAESAGALLAYAYFNYTVPTGASQLESLYHVKDAIGHANMTIPSTCWGATLYLRAMGSDIGNSITWQCDNGPGWTTLRSSVANIAYEQEMKFKYVSSWDNSTAAPNITLSSLTANTKYYFRARSHNTTNDSLSTNSSTFDFTTAAATNPITITDGNRALLCNWTIDTTFTNIATNLTNCTDFFAYNSTSQLWAFYSINRTINANTTISEHAAIFIHFNATTTVDCNILTAETITIPANVWYYTALRESAAKALTEINASITSDGCLVTNLYAWDSPAGAYTNTGSYSVLPNEGFAIYATTGCSWDGAV